MIEKVPVKYRDFTFTSCADILIKAKIPANLLLLDKKHLKGFIYVAGI